MNAPHGRGWEYIGHGERIDETFIPQCLHAAIKTLERQEHERAVFGITFDPDDSPACGPFDYDWVTRRDRIAYGRQKAEFKLF